MKILAVDPGFGRVGVAIIEKIKGKEKIVYSSCIITLASSSLPERISFIGKKMGALIKKHKPTCLAIETLLFNTNQKTAMGVAQARGVVLYEAFSQGLSIYEYTPLQIKTAITGYGRAPKEQIALMVEQLIPIKNIQKKLDDEIDAIAIGLTHFAYVKEITQQ